MTLEQQLSDSVSGAALDARTVELVWAAWNGEETLTAVLDTSGPDADTTGGASVSVDGSAPASGTASSPAAAGVWLSSIAVEGFRGIGRRSELLLNPGPGLTLVVGRNGSGKSSFAEGLEALLTGDSMRWRGRPAAWQDGWRNLHHDGKVTVSAGFVREGDPGETAVARQWADSFTDSRIDCTIADRPIEFDWLGWTEALSTFKPFLSYNELGSMLEQKPSAIYDSMAAVLGLERLTEARERLRRARLEAEKPTKELKGETDSLRATLAGSDDPRAATAAELVAARKPDFGAVRVLAERGSDGVSADVAAAARLEPIDAERCLAAAADLESALTRRTELGATDAGRSRRVADLLRGALDHRDHDSHEAGATPCPVCGEGTLDDAWRTQAIDEIDRLEGEAAAATEAETAVTRARQAAISALVGPPGAVTRWSPAVADIWSAWSQAPDEGWTEPALVDRLAQVGELNARIEEIRRSAQAELDRSDEAWRPFAELLLVWVRNAESAEQSKLLAKELKAGEDFYKSAEADLRAERFRPIAEQAGALWSILRQQSNVTLERVALEGTTTQRRVALDVTVDGTDTSALGVMSQGELHALALTLFLPRVTSTDSPFRFVMIDDPVQAMDAARVDGLARVLEQVAAERQVVVFTHDDRLPASCRRLGIKTDVINVHRQSESRVSTTMGESPSLDAIRNAYTLAKTEQIPPALKRSVVPAQCRLALEAQLHDAVWGTMLARGRSHDEISELLAEADRTVDLLALWMFGRRASPDEVYDELDRRRQGAAAQIRYLHKAVHEPPHDLNPEALTGTVRSLIQFVAEG